MSVVSTVRERYSFGIRSERQKTRRSPSSTRSAGSLSGSGLVVIWNGSPQSVPSWTRAQSSRPVRSRVPEQPEVASAAGERGRLVAPLPVLQGCRLSPDAGGEDARPQARASRLVPPPDEPEPPVGRQRGGGLAVLPETLGQPHRRAPDRAVVDARPISALPRRSDSPDEPKRAAGPGSGARPAVGRLVVGDTEWLAPAGAVVDARPHVPRSLAVRLPEEPQVVRRGGRADRRGREFGERRRQFVRTADERRRLGLGRPPATRVRPAARRSSARRAACSRPARVRRRPPVEVPGGRQSHGHAELRSVVRHLPSSRTGTSSGAFVRKRLWTNSFA